MTESEQQALLAIAQEAAEAAAAELRPRFGGNDLDVRSKSTPTDLVSDADVAAEQAVRAVLAERRPGDSILGEEGGSTGDDGNGAADRRLQWVVDPLDGTINYLFGIPVFSVSVACVDASGAVAGVVLDPIRDECFQATRSGAPTMNGAEIHPSGRSDLATAMVATGFAYDAEVRARQGAVVARLLPAVRDIRRVGSAALDLCWCACGRYDAFYERGLHAWDMAAGALIARRAGLEVRDLEEGPGDPHGVVVAPDAFMAELYELVG